MGRMTITAETSPEDVAHALNVGDELTLHRNLTRGELLHLVARTFAHTHGQELATLVVKHQNADSSVLRHVLDRFGHSGSLANDIATSGRCDAPLLRLLRKHPAESVREHAALGLVHLELERNDDWRAKRLLKTHQGDAGIALGVRHVLATHPNTPEDILRELQNDEADLIADAATKETQRRRGEQH